MDFLLIIDYGLKIAAFPMFMILLVSAFGRKDDYYSGAKKLFWAGIFFVFLFVAVRFSLDPDLALSFVGVLVISGKIAWMIPFMFASFLFARTAYKKQGNTGASKLRNISLTLLILGFASAIIFVLALGPI